MSSLILIPNFLKFKAMDVEKKIDVLQENKILSGTSEREKASQDAEFYAINQGLEFDLSYGVTKISIKGFYPLRLGGKTLAFYNDLSLKRLFESDNVSQILLL